MEGRVINEVIVARDSEEFCVSSELDESFHELHCLRRTFRYRIVSNVRRKREQRALARQFTRSCFCDLKAGTKGVPGTKGEINDSYRILFTSSKVLGASQT